MVIKTEKLPKNGKVETAPKGKPGEKVVKARVILLDDDGDLTTEIAWIAYQTQAAKPKIEAPDWR